MKDKQITFFVPFENRNAITKYNNATIVTYHSTSITKLFMPNKTLIQKLNSMEFELVIDLERNENTFMSAVANIVKSKVRIGFKKNRSENYYNLLIQNSDQNIESNYMNLLTSIKML
jgi:ADP-heptose:LPS heptosyltransferase